MVIEKNVPELSCTSGFEGMAAKDWCLAMSFPFLDAKRSAKVDNWSKPDPGLHRSASEFHPKCIFLPLMIHNL